MKAPWTPSALNEINITFWSHYLRRLGLNMVTKKDLLSSWNQIPPIKSIAICVVN
jgi:hypothetical protein